MTTALRRPAAVLIAAAALAGGFAGTAAAEPSAADVIVSAPFAADSGDACPMGATRGRLGWHVDGFRTVDVAGTVLDHPLPAEPNTRCREDGRFTAATFTAFAKNVPFPLDAESQAVNNGTADVRLQLTATRAIDFVVVQVCRRSLFVGPPEICGAPVRVPVPVITLP
jgi:hypothetical protein